MPWTTHLSLPLDPTMDRGDLARFVSSILSELAARLRHGTCTVLSPQPPQAQRGESAHWHPHPELFIPLAGSSILDTDDGPLRCRDGTVVVIPAQAAHEERVETAQGPFANLVVAVISNRLVYHLGGNWPAGTTGAGIVCPGSTPVADAFGMLCLERSHAMPGRHGRDLQIGSLMAFCAWACTTLETKSETMSGSAERMRKVRWLIGNRLGWSDLSVESLAREMGLHPDHLTRLFKAETGDTLVSFIRQQRIQHAQRLLVEQPGLEVRSIATMCGFSDGAYFSRVFQQTCGVTPATWRKEQLELKASEAEAEG